VRIAHVRGALDSAGDCEYDRGVPPIRLAGVALVAIGLVAAAAHGASVARTCVRDACRPQNKQCLQAFRGKKQAALAACAGAGSAKPCRAAARRVAKSGMQACRASMRDCVACCKATGGGCHVAACGNELVEGGEACDGASAGSCAGDCRDDCTCAPVAACGNATVDEGEQCDGASDSACPGRCHADCTCGPPPPTCGNGVVDAGEQCDGASHAACEIACGAYCTCVAPVRERNAGGTEVRRRERRRVPGALPEDARASRRPRAATTWSSPARRASRACTTRVHRGLPARCTCAVCGNDVIEAPVETCEPTDDAACPGLCSSESCQCLSPTTDTCEGARELGTFPALDRQSTIGATTDGTDPAFACGFEGAAIPHQGTVWYAFVAPRTGRVTADTGGSFFDSVLAAYTGTCGALSMVACNDDTPRSLNARFEFPVAGGTRYLLQAAAYTAEVPRRSRDGGRLHAVRRWARPDEACGSESAWLVPERRVHGPLRMSRLAADECRMPRSHRAADPREPRGVPDDRRGDGSRPLVRVQLRPAAERVVPIRRADGRRRRRRDDRRQLRHRARALHRRLRRADAGRLQRRCEPHRLPVPPRTDGDGRHDVHRPRHEL
jgi:hypothetical protein